MKINHPVTDHEVLLPEGTILVTKTDLTGQITYANEAFMDVTGYSNDELIGSAHNIVRHPDMPSAVFEDLWNTISKDRPWNKLIKARCKNGDYYWVDSNITPIYEQGKVSGYTSAGYLPSREQVRDAEQLYNDIRNNQSGIRDISWRDRVNPIKRLSIQGKLSLIAILLIIPSLVLLGMFNHEKNVSIEFSEKELRGIEYLTPLKQLLVQLSEHRSLVDNYLTADSGGRDNAAIIQNSKSVGYALSAVETIESRYGIEFKSDELFKKIQQNWNKLDQQSLQLSAQESFSQHGQLIEAVNELMVHVSDQSNLTLDPDVDSYYLMSLVSIQLPELIDHTSELRSVGVREAKRGGMLAGDAKIDLAVLNQHISDRVSELEHNFSAVYQANQSLKEVFATNQDDFSLSLSKITEIVKKDIYQTNSIAASADQVSLNGTVAIQSVSKLYDLANLQLKMLIQKRIDNMNAERMIQISVILLVLVAVSLIGFVIIRYIVTGLKGVNKTFASLTQGNFRNSVDLDGNDELGDLLRGLQIMQVNLNVDISNARERAIKATRAERALDNVSSAVMMANNNFEIIYMNKAVVEFFKGVESDFRKQLPNFDASKLLGANIDQFHANPMQQRNMLAKLDSSHKASAIIGGRNIDLVATAVKETDGNRLGTVVEWFDRTREVRIEKEIESIVESVKTGQLDQRLDLSDKNGFFAKLSEGINEFSDVIERVFKDISSTMESMADGDLTNKITSDYQGVYLECKNDINATMDKLSDIFGRVSESASFINNSSQEIASGNNNLSQRAEQQAANLEETAASMEELTSTVKNNAENAQQANIFANSARELAEKGGSVVNAAVSAMQEINESSNKIADIIGVIDEIAFQTNLLALNASVEAARAGEQGRGFSVVATEVRNLAQRSATAARESKELIQTSVQKVRAGTEFVNETGKALTEIVSGVKKVGDIVAQIAAASVEQSAGITQVNQAVAQMDEITQQNAALAEEASAASVSMSDLSTNMVDVLSFFKVDKKTANKQQAMHHGNHAGNIRVDVFRSNNMSLVNTYKSATSDDEWQDF